MFLRQRSTNPESSCSGTGSTNAAHSKIPSDDSHDRSTKVIDIGGSVRASMMVGGTAELLWTARATVLDAVARDRWTLDSETSAIVADLGSEQARTLQPQPGPLAAAADAFHLATPETAALALVAAVEIDVRFGALLARVQGNSGMLRPTVGTLLELTGIDSVAAFLPGAALRRNLLIDIEGDGPLPFRTVRCPDDCWARLAGIAPMPPAPADELQDLVVPADLATAILETAEWLRGPEDEHALVVVWGRPGSGRHAVARAILAATGRRGIELGADSITEPRRFVEIERDARWANHVPALTSDAPGPTPAARAWLDTARGARIWIQCQAPDWLVDTPVPARVVHVPELDAERRAELWRRALRHAKPELASDLAGRFQYGPARIARVVEMARRSEGVTVESVIAATRATSRPGITLLAERLPPRSRHELVVSPGTARQIDVAISWAASHVQLYGAWGLTTSVARARGFTCLFSGPPGTGKTLGAQIVAGAIDRDLFRVDLSQAVSKWLGETEKNLGRVFDEARDAGAVLFFDEADSLFARRTQVRDSNDRYANLETGYLLQRVESHDGIVILATNRRQDLDSAFLRRFEVIIEFAPPGPAERELLWRRHLPDERRCDADIDPPSLAKLFELSGGQIRNAIITSIALTSLDDGPNWVRDVDSPRLGMRHLVGGATRELVRTGRLVNPADYGSWAPTVRSVVSAAAEST
jgi:hypothetical protein